MKKVMIFARDPGGANAVFPLIYNLEKEYCVVVYAKDAAIQIFERENIHLVPCEIHENYKELTQIVASENPDMIITGTSVDDFCERYLWKIANDMGIPAMAVLDHWCNYGIRFSCYSLSEYKKYLEEYSHDYIPDKILVMDEFAKVKLIDEKVPGEKIIVTGQPHFEWLNTKIKQSDMRKKLQDDVIRILFVSEPFELVYGGRKEAIAKLGYSEKTIFEELLKSIDRLDLGIDKKVELIIKLHPRDTRDSYNNYIYSKDINIHYEVREHIWEFLPEMNIVCGISSMMLIESYLCGKSVLSVQIGAKNINNFILEEWGKVKGILTREELDKEIADQISYEKEADTYDIKLKACMNIMRQVEDMI